MQRLRKWYVTARLIFYIQYCACHAIERSDLFVIVQSKDSDRNILNDRLLEVPLPLHLLAGATQNGQRPQ